MEELIFDGLKEIAHNIKMWCRSRWHLHKAVKGASIVELIISMCYDEEDTRWQYTRDKSEIICEIGSGTYQAQMGTQQTLTLADAFHVPFRYKGFVYTLLDNQNEWPTGVEYFCHQGKDFQISIRVRVNLNYSDCPKDYLRGYMNYLHELQTEIHKQYNQYRQENPIQEETPQYNIV